MVTKNPNNFDEALIQDAIFRGIIWSAGLSFLQTEW